ncbi:MAG: chemotaxis protein CheD [Clostridiaceae bacterium]|nr:chemotaxis protein CheD [Clostridiaceae bacterium]
MDREIKVGIADLNVTSTPNKLITVGLGSCIGITLYDKVKKNGGLLHIMLPDSTQFSSVTNPFKFADLGVPILLKKIQDMGSRKNDISAKIAGGASMFNFSDKSMIMDIGSRNSVAVKRILAELEIPLLREDIGGNNGRTIIFDTSTGSLLIRTVGKEMKEI